MYESDCIFRHRLIDLVKYYQFYRFDYIYIFFQHHASYHSPVVITCTCQFLIYLAYIQGKYNIQYHINNLSNEFNFYPTIRPKVYLINIYNTKCLHQCNWCTSKKSSIKRAHIERSSYLNAVHVFTSSPVTSVFPFFTFSLKEVRAG